MQARNGLPPSGALRVLLVDDDVDFCVLLQAVLQSRDIKVDAVHDGRRGLTRALGGEYDLVLLDIVLPGLDGFEILRQIRRRSLVPVILVTARATTEDRIAGLDAGADDYLSKPFDPDELIARLRAVHRRVKKSPGTVTEVIEANRVKLVPATREAWADGYPVELTTIEFDILALIVQSAGRIISRNELASAIHHRPASPLDRSLDVHVSRLRKKLCRQGELIRTIRGVGYLFRPELHVDVHQQTEQSEAG